MKHFLLGVISIITVLSITAQEAMVSGPDGKLNVKVVLDNGSPFYSITYNDKVFLERSPLGLKTSIGDFSKQLKVAGQRSKQIEEDYNLNRSKQSKVH